jgi:large subunit ribosomal protein L15
MKGGRGQAGLHKHKWTYTVKYDPNHFGKKGFKCPTGQGKVEAINLGRLDQKVNALVQEGKLEAEDGKYTIDLEELGYVKLLGGGRLTTPLTVKVKLCSKRAAEKIQGLGGTLILASAHKEA